MLESQEKPGARKTYSLHPQPGAVVLWIPDIHYGDQDDHAVNAMLKFMAEKHGKWWLSVFLGDAIDAYSVSEYPKRASVLEKFGGLRQEFSEFRPTLEHVCYMSDETLWIMGNHEHRVELAIDKAGMNGMVDFASLAGVGDLGNLTVLPHGARVKVGKTVGEHGDRLRGGNSPQAIARNYPFQVSISGHNHRLESAYYTGYGLSGEPKIRAAFKAGMLANYQPASGYTSDPCWTQGFVEQEFFKNGRFRITPHAIYEGEVF